MRRLFPVLLLLVAACGANEASPPTAPASAASAPSAGATTPASPSAATPATSASAPPLASASATPPTEAPPAEPLPPPETFDAKAALVTKSALLGKTHVTLYDKPVTCATRVSDREAPGTRTFDVTVEWRAGWTWTLDPQVPIHPARFNLYKRNEFVRSTKSSVSSWFPTEGQVEVLAASAKRGRVRVRLTTVKAIVDATLDASMCD